MSESAAKALHDALAAELRAAQGVAHVNVRSWADQTSITHDTIYRILNGKRAVTVVELVALCHAIDDDPLELVARAAKRAGIAVSDDVNEVVRADRARLAVAAAGLEDLDDAYVQARAALGRAGHLLPPREWRAFIDGAGARSLVVALATFLEVPADYLLGQGLDDAEVQRIESQLRLARNMRSLGVTRLAARSLDELDPEEIAVVEEAIQTLIEKEQGPKN